MRSSKGWRLLFHVAIVSLLSGCGSSAVKAPVEGRTNYASRSPTYHTVKKGDTLYAIAWQHGLDYREVASWNRIRAPYLIYPGERLRVKRPPAYKASKTRPGKPGQPVRSSAKSGSAGGSRFGSGAARTPPPPQVARTESRPVIKKSEPRAAKAVNWTWPAEGKVVRRFAKEGNRGVDIAGKLGQPVYAAGDGRVVYSGSGLVGYGKLIIVKHNKEYLSAYAYNDKLLVQEGDTVAGGQRIADMGRTGANQVKLHFEIRRNGKPVDPLRYLPKI